MFMQVVSLINSLMSKQVKQYVLLFYAIISNFNFNFKRVE